MLYDAEGRQYVGMYNNVPCVGHAHPRVVPAMIDQADTLNVHCRYLHEEILDYAERLLLLHDDSLTCAVFACSGTEANEVPCAWRARRRGAGDHLHRLRLSRQQLRSRQADAPGSDRSIRSRDPFDTISPVLSPNGGRSVGSGVDRILTGRGHRTDRRFRRQGHSLCRHADVPVVGQRGPSRHSRGIHGACRQCRAGGGRVVYHRRGAVEFL